MTAGGDFQAGAAALAQRANTLPVALFQDDLAGSQRARLARAWLWLGLAALIGAGVYSIILVASRTPYLNQFLPGVDFFRVSLVLHVDLSVLVWFISLAGLFWTMQGKTRLLALAWASLWLCAVGTLAMAVAPFVAPGAPVMANYIPVLDSKLFLAGLVVLGAGASLLVLRALLVAPPLRTRFGEQQALGFGMSCAAVAAAVAIMAFVWSWLDVPTAMQPQAYYEVLFWGGGHSVQYTWTLLMLVAWMWLVRACGARLLISPRLLVLLFLLSLLGVFITPYAYLAHPIASVEHRDMLTWAMQFGGGIAVVPMALAAVLAVVLVRCQGAQKPLKAALLASVLLFGAGGIIGLFIDGSNVKIPAHYHGCIVGVTLAFMGVVYHLLPALGYRAPTGRLAYWQPWLYGIGQLMHIIGLVWSGGYGVQRKVAGAQQVLRSSAETMGMGLMGLGGLIAIIGGLLFVVVVIRAMRRR